MNSFIKIFPRKFACAAKQIQHRGYQVGYCSDEGFDYSIFEKTQVAQIAAGARSVSPDLIICEGTKINTYDLQSEMLKKLINRPGHPCMNWVARGMTAHGMDVYNAYNAKINSCFEEQFCFAFGRWFGLTFFPEKGWRSIFFDEKALKDGNFNFEIFQ